ncbi:hypothetical protein HN51_019528 [Arachis hypogaea]
MSNDHKASDIDEECRVFYLTVDPFAKMHSIPSLFYRKYNHFLEDKMRVVDTNRNQITLRIAKGYNTAYIMEGLHFLVQLYGLKQGGTIKLRYLFRDIFYVIKVRDDKMASLPILYHYMKGRLDDNFSHKGKQVIQTDPLFDEIERFYYGSYKVNKKKKKNSAKVTNRQTNNKDRYGEHAVPVKRKTFFKRTSNTKAHDVALEIPKYKLIAKHLDIDLNVVPPVDEEDVNMQEPSMGNNNHLDHHIDKPTDLSRALTTVPAKFHEFMPSDPVGQLVDCHGCPFDFPGFNAGPFGLYFPNNFSINAPYYSFVRELTNHDIQCSYLNVPTNFAMHAFPSRFYHVCLLQHGGFQYHMGLRWKMTPVFIQVDLNTGWRGFVRNNLLRIGSVLRFTACPLNESFMYVEIWKC